MRLADRDRRRTAARDEVIASATFLLDSESNLAAAIQGLMLQMGMASTWWHADAPREGERRP